MFFTKSTRRGQRLDEWTTAADFRRDVDFVVSLFRLNPELPEIAELKANAKELMVKDVQSGRPVGPVYILRMLNPQDDVSFTKDGTLVIHERWFGHLLSAWSLVRHHRGYIDEQLSKIVADSRGTHLFCGSDRTATATIEGGAINPYRFADPGNRYRNACAVVKEFTGLDLIETKQVLVGGTKTITVTKDQDGSWGYELEQLPRPEPSTSN